MRSRRPRPSGSGQDYDSTPAEGLQPRCLILLLAIRPLPLTASNQDPRAFAHRAGDPLPFFSSFSSFRPAISQPPPEKFPLCIRLCPAFYISLKVKLTRATMTERKLLLHQGQDRCPIFPILPLVSARRRPRQDRCPIFPIRPLVSARRTWNLYDWHGIKDRNLNILIDQVILKKWY